MSVWIFSVSATTTNILSPSMSEIVISRFSLTYLADTCTRFPLVACRLVTMSLSLPHSRCLSLRHPHRSTLRCRLSELIVNVPNNYGNFQNLVDLAFCHINDMWHIAFWNSSQLIVKLFGRVCVCALVRLWMCAGTRVYVCLRVCVSVCEWVCKQYSIIVSLVYAFLYWNHR